MAVELVIALGYKGLNAVPKVLYTGVDVDAAMEAVKQAGDKGSIVEGKVLRSPEQGATIWRHRFEPAVV